MSSDSGLHFWATLYIYFESAAKFHCLLWHIGHKWPESRLCHLYTFIRVLTFWRQKFKDFPGLSTALASFFLNLLHLTHNVTVLHCKCHNYCGVYPRFPAGWWYLLFSSVVFQGPAAVHASCFILRLLAMHRVWSSVQCMTRRRSSYVDWCWDCMMTAVPSFPIHAGCDG